MIRVNLDLEIVNLPETIQGLFEYFEAGWKEQGVLIAGQKDEQYRYGRSGNASPRTQQISLQRDPLHAARGNRYREVSARMSKPHHQCRESGRADSRGGSAKLFNRFPRRSSRQRKGDGAGWGLRIVSRIHARRHGGKFASKSARRR